VVGAGVALLEPPPLSVPVKEATEAESAAPRIGNLDGFGGGGSSEPVDPATNPNSLVISCTKTVGHRRVSEVFNPYHEDTYGNKLQLHKTACLRKLTEFSCHEYLNLT